MPNQKVQNQGYSQPTQILQQSLYPQPNYQNNYQVILYKLKNKIKTLKTVSVLLVFLLVATAVLSTVLLISNGVVGQNKASTLNATNLSVKITDNNGIYVSFLSTKNGFEFSYDNNTWKTPVEKEGSVQLSLKSDGLVNSTGVLSLPGNNLYLSKISDKTTNLSDIISSNKTSALARGEVIYDEKTLTVETASVSAFFTKSDVLKTRIESNYTYIAYYFVQNDGVKFLAQFTSPNLLFADNVNLDKILISLKENLSTSASVKGASNTSTSLDINIERNVAQNRPGVYRVYTKQCGNYTIKSNSRYSEFSAILGDKSKDICNGASGSGFVVDDQCHLATNGHVVIQESPAVTLFREFFADKKILKALLEDYLAIQIASGKLTAQGATNLLNSDTAKDQLVNGLALLVAEMFQNGTLKATFGDVKYFIQKPNVAIDNSILFTPTTTALEESKMIASSLLGYDYNANDVNTGKFTASDVALLTLKTTCSSLIINSLGTVDNLTAGTAVTVVGFPGSGTDTTVSSGLSDLQSATQATVTNGIVSAIKQDSGGRTLIQTDTSINHGNSGGPCYDGSGKVVGLATYGLTSDKAINFCRNVADLQKLMTKFSLTNKSNPVTTLFTTGLDAYYQKKYYTAVNKLQQAKIISPQISDIDKFINLATTNEKEAIDSPFDSGTFTPGYLAGIILAGIALILMIVFIIVLIMLLGAQGSYKKVLKVLQQMPQMPQQQQAMY